MSGSSRVSGATGNIRWRVNPIASAYDSQVFQPSSYDNAQAGQTCILHPGGKGDECIGTSPAPAPSIPTGGGRPGSNPERGHSTKPAALHGRSWPARDWKWLLAGVLLVLLGALPFVKTVVRRIEVARASAPGELVFAAYRRLLAEASDLGWRRRRAETLWEFRTRLRDGVGTLDGDDLDMLTRLAAAAVYGQGAVTEHEADQAVAASERVADDLRRSSSIPRRMLSRFWFGSADGRG